MRMSNQASSFKGKPRSFNVAKSAAFSPHLSAGKRRELYQNAKKVNKYKKLMKHMNEQSSSFQNLSVAAVDPEKHKLDQNKLLRGSNISYQHKDAKDRIFTKRHPVIPDFRAKHLADSKKRKAMNSLEILRQEYEKERAEKEKARKEEEAALASQKEQRERARKARKDIQLKMRKKTSTGQPVMKHRLQHLLEKIQQT